MTDNQATASRMQVVGKPRHWWIVGCGKPMGPYRTREEAHADKMGVQRFLRNCHKRNFVTTEG